MTAIRREIAVVIVCQLVLACSILVLTPSPDSLVSHATAGNVFEYANTTILRCSNVYFVDPTAWSPQGGDYITAVASNDGESSYILCNSTKSYNEISYDTDTFVEDPVYENATYDVVVWVVAHGQFPGVARLMLAVRSDTANPWEASLIVRRASVLTSYTNWTVRTNGCPWTGENWTVDTINAIKIGLWTNGIGQYRVTEIGILVYTIVPFPAGQNEAPEITQMPGNVTRLGHIYRYYPVAVDPDNSPENLLYSMTTNASWLTINTTTGEVNGTANVTGYYWIEVAVTDGLALTTLNYTLLVEPMTDPLVLGLVLALAFGFGTIVLSLIDHRQRFWWSAYAGLTWLAISVVVFSQIGLLWFALGLGIGLVLFLKAGMERAAGRSQ